LALASTLRPTSLAAVYALVREQSPRRLMTAYVAAGLVFTVAFGLIIILAFKGIHLRSGSKRTKGIAEIAGGVLAIGLGAGVLSGRIGGRQAEDAPPFHGRWEGRLSRGITTRTAVLAGPATHIPGLLYLIALDLIVASQPGLPGGLVQVLLYNAIWFALPLGALIVCIVDPPAARRAVEAVHAWASAHARAIVLTVSFGLGAALLLTGALTV
jgi:Sap, sulfolipid-1-addressing protein